jgi:hypothetical protein
VLHAQYDNKNRVEGINGYQYQWYRSHTAHGVKTI